MTEAAANELSWGFIIGCLILAVGFNSGMCAVRGGLKAIARAIENVEDEEDEP